MRNQCILTDAELFVGPDFLVDPFFESGRVHPALDLPEKPGLQETGKPDIVLTFELGAEAFQTLRHAGRGRGDYGTGPSHLYHVTSPIRGSSRGDGASGDARAPYAAMGLDWRRCSSTIRAVW